MPPITVIPAHLTPFFQEYDVETLHLEHDANLIIQRALEFGDWNDLRWLFRVYSVRRLRAFLRQYGERWLSPVSFNYWRKLLGIRQWNKSSLPTQKGALWAR